MRTVTLIVALSLVVAAGAGCRTLTGRSAGENIDDTRITAVVKSKLTAEQLRNLTWIDVDTRAGTVYLTGFAPTPEDAQRAVQLASDTNGVRQVVSNLQVRDVAGRRAPVAPAASPTAPAPPPTR
jgi:osmotically-inducible protein OsmY